MKVKEMAAKSEKELTNLFNDLTKKLQEARVNSRTRDTKNVKEIQNLKRDIARIHTINRARELAVKEEK